MWKEARKAGIKRLARVYSVWLPESSNNSRYYPDCHLRIPIDH